MTTKTWLLITVAAILGGIYLYYFTDLINTPRIQILKSDRLLRYGRAPAPTFPVSFTFDGQYALTSVKVIPVAALTTNRHPAPLWHLVSKSNSVPMHGFLYGDRIRGMQPARTNTAPQPLEAGVLYRLLVQAKGAKGEIDFQARALAQGSP